MIISLVAAVATNRVIGKDNDLPWRLPDDMKFFMETTIDHFVIMGRKSYEALPPKFKPLPNRVNIIITRQADYAADDCIIAGTIEEALADAETNAQQEVFIIGGGNIFAQAIPLADKLYLTEVKASIDGDTFWPEYDQSQWQEVSRQHHDIDDRHNYEFDFVVYDRKPEN
jgi:dihydrofolate reductase